MPVFNCNNDLPPSESEVEIIKIIHLAENDVYSINVHKKKEKIFIAEGKVLIKTINGIRDFNKNNFEEFLIDKNQLEQIIAFEDSIIIRIGGDWNYECGTCGFFELSESLEPKNIGDPTNYERNTEFDNHFHDCDEFWILYDGEGEVVTEDNKFTVKAGDCIFTKAGDHHDFPIIKKTVKGIWFETSLIGEKRSGHLWNHHLNKIES